MQRAAEVVAKTIQVVCRHIRALRPVHPAERGSVNTRRHGHLVQGDAPPLGKSQVRQYFLKLEANHVWMVVAKKQRLQQIDNSRFIDAYNLHSSH